MATNGSFNTTAYTDSDGTRYLTFSWELVSQSIENNSSVISWQLKGAGGNSSYWWKCRSVSVIINGTTVYSSATAFNLYHQVVASGTATIQHDDSGDKTFTASAQAAIYSSAINSTGSGSWALTSIPRASDITLDKDTMTYGDALAVTITKKIDSYTHKIYLSCNNDAYTLLAEDVDDSYSFNLTTEYATRLIASSNTIIIRVATYSSDTLIGTTNSDAVTITTPDAFAPVIAFAQTDINSHISKYGGYVKTQSQFDVTATPTYQYGATQSALSLSNGTTTITSSAETVTGTYTADGSTYTATARDSRGLSTSSTLTPTVYDWYNPVLTDTAVIRSTSTGTEDDEGAYFTITANYSIAQVDSKNSKTCAIKYKTTDSDTWSTVNVTLSSYSGSISRTIAASTEKAYDVQLSISDDFATASVTKILPTAYTLIDFGASGQSIAIGKVSTNTSKLFEIADGWSTSGIKTSDLTNDAGFITSAEAVTVDEALSDTSINPVQNKIINSALNNKANASDVPTVLSALTNDVATIQNVSATKSVSANTATLLTSIDLEPGFYVITGNLTSSTNGTGLRFLYIHGNSNYMQENTCNTISTSTRIGATAVVEVTATETIKMSFYSSVALSNCSCILRALKIA